jgi:copper chaperone CopZ
MTEAGTLTLSVPSMHCAVACYPRVKETLEGVDGVSEVVLDKQKEEGLIDNRQVVLSYDAGFDLTAALANLSQEGFEDASVVQ